MAIAFDTGSRSTSASFSATAPASSNSALVAIVSTAGSAAGLTATYNSVSLTSNAPVDVPVAGDGHTIFTVLNPTAGSNTFAITGATSPDTTVLFYTGVGAITGANSTTGTAPTSINMTVSVANSWVVTASRRRPGPVASTPSTGVTNDRTTLNAAVGSGDSGPEAAGTINHTWSGGGSDMSISGIVLEPSTETFIQKIVIF